MVNLLNRSRCTPIGIDIRDSEICAIQFRAPRGRLSASGSEEGPVIQAAVTRRLGEGEGMSGALETLTSIIREGGFVGKDVVCSLPHADVDIRPLTIQSQVDPADEVAFAEALNLEAITALPYDPSVAYTDYLSMGTETVEGDERHKVLLIAAKQETVNRQLALFKTVGLNCLHLDVGPCAISRILSVNGAPGAPKDKTYCMVNFDSESTEVSVFEGGQLCFSRTVRLGFGHMLDELMRSLKIGEWEAGYLLRAYGGTDRIHARCDYKEIAERGILNEEVLFASVFEICSFQYDKLTQELNRSVSYFARQRDRSPVEEVALIGGCLSGNMARLVSDRLGIPTSLFDVFEHLNVDARKVFGSGNAYAVATGLALREGS